MLSGSRANHRAGQTLQAVQVQAAGPGLENSFIGVDEYGGGHAYHFVLAYYAAVAGEAGGIGDSQFFLELTGLPAGAQTGELAHADA